MNLARRLRTPLPSDLGTTANPALLPRALRVFTRVSRDTLSARPLVNLEHHVLAFSLAGTGEIVIDETACRLRRGEAVLLFPRQYHYYRRFSDSQPVWFFMSFVLMDDSPLLPLKHTVICLTPPLWNRLDAVLRAADAQRSRGGGPADTVAAAWLLLEQLTRVQRRHRRPLHTDRVSQRLYRLLLDAQMYIMKHLCEPLRARDIANAVSLSPSYLQMLFARYAGSSLGRYVTGRRLARAAALLHRDDRPLKQIAIECGFRSTPAFIRRFKRKFGVTPAAFRRRASVDAGPWTGGGAARIRSPRPVRPGRS